MSFYTSLSYDRPTKPPRVTGSALAKFVHDLVETGLFERKGGEYLYLKFGRSIDQDEKPTIFEVPVRGVPGMYSVRSIKWDIEHDRIPLPDALTLLSNHDRPIYRAAVTLGILRRDVIADLQTRRPDDGRPNLCFWDGTVHLGPVSIGSMSSETSFAVGWMDVSFGGNGYLWPWKARDVTSRAMAHPALQVLADVCRRSFPVDPDGAPTVMEKLTPSRRRVRVRMIRQRMGDLWPFEDLDAPWDWYWGVAETG